MLGCTARSLTGSRHNTLTFHRPDSCQLKNQVQGDPGSPSALQTHPKQLKTNCLGDFRCLLPLSHGGVKKYGNSEQPALSTAKVEDSFN